jgi:hypothetical protein
MTNAETIELRANIEKRLREAFSAGVEEQLERDIEEARDAREEVLAERIGEALQEQFDNELEERVEHELEETRDAREES